MCITKNSDCVHVRFCHDKGNKWLLQYVMVLLHYVSLCSDLYLLRLQLWLLDTLSFTFFLVVYMYGFLFYSDC